MNQENPGPSSSTPKVLAGKRKRGRPRRYDGLDILGTTGSNITARTRHQRVDSVEFKYGDLVGQAVCGVVDGSFDAGYLVSVKVHDTNMVLRGAVFEPGRSVPISDANDVAPQAKMIKRSEIPISDRLPHQVATYVPHPLPVIPVPVAPLNELPAYLSQPPPVIPVPIGLLNQLPTNVPQTPHVAPVPVGLLNQVPTDVPQPPPVVPHNINYATMLTQVSPANQALQKQKDNGSGPSRRSMNDLNHVPDVAAFRIQSEKKTANLEEDSEKCGKSGESQTMQETSLETKGACYDFDKKPSLICPLPLVDKIHAFSEVAMITTHANEQAVQNMEVLKETETSVQVGESVNNMTAPEDKTIEFTAEASTGVIHCDHNVVETPDAFNQIPEVPKDGELELTMLASAKVLQGSETACEASNALHYCHNVRERPDAFNQVPKVPKDVELELTILASAKVLQGSETACEASNALYYCHNVRERPDAFNQVPEVRKDGELELTILSPAEVLQGSETACEAPNALHYCHIVRETPDSFNQVPEVPKDGGLELTVLSSAKVLQGRETACEAPNALHHGHNVRETPDAFNQVPEVPKDGELELTILSSTKVLQGSEITREASNALEQDKNADDVKEVLFPLASQCSEHVKLSKEFQDLEIKIDQPTADMEIQQSDTTAVGSLRSDDDPTLQMVLSDAAPGMEISQTDVAERERINMVDLSGLQGKTDADVLGTSRTEASSSTPENDQETALPSKKRSPLLLDLMAPAESDEAVLETSCNQPMHQTADGEADAHI